MSTHRLREHARIVTLPSGERALVIETVPPEDAPESVREGFARRALVNGGSACPCGAAWPSGDPLASDDGGVSVIAVHHAEDCPGSDAALRAALEAWTAGGAR